MDERRHALLRDLERALFDALSESAEVHRTLEKMHDAGFTLLLQLDCRREADSGAAEESPRSAAEPSFRINSDDLMMLRSLGIDPTRKSRSRRAG
ncbi:MAG: hypothetical protein AB7G12_10470 [Thermoanaerobaculia bacterium]